MLALCVPRYGMPIAYAYVIVGGCGGHVQSASQGRHFCTWGAAYGFGVILIYDFAACDACVSGLGFCWVLGLALAVVVLLFSVGLLLPCAKIFASAFRPCSLVTCFARKDLYCSSVRVVVSGSILYRSLCLVIWRLIFALRCSSACFSCLNCSRCSAICASSLSILLCLFFNMLVCFLSVLDFLFLGFCF